MRRYPRTSWFRFSTENGPAVTFSRTSDGTWAVEFPDELLSFAEPQVAWKATGEAFGRR
jgi:hypothetical protein